MVRKAYSREARLEAVALARLSGVDIAAEQLGMDPRTVRKWTDQAGDGPELAAPAGLMAGLFDLASARVAAALTSGKLSAVQQMTIAAIAKRNMDRPRAVPVGTTAALALDVFTDWLVAQVDLDTLTDDAAYATAVEAIRATYRVLLRIANDEPERRHRHAMLTWVSGRRDIPPEEDEAPADLIPWAQAIVTAGIAEHGDLVGWTQAAQAAEDARREAERVRAEAMRLDAKRRYLAPDLDAVLAQAEAYLQEVT